MTRHAIFPYMENSLKSSRCRYRDEMSLRQGVRIPLIGLMMRDFTFLAENRPYTEDHEVGYSRPNYLRQYHRNVTHRTDDSRRSMMLRHHLDHDARHGDDDDTS